MDGLRYAFLHNSWATRRLIEACRGLTPEQLEATTPGAMGSVLRTLKHIIDGEGHGFGTLLTGAPPAWEWRLDETPDLATLAARAEQNERLWTDYLATGVDAERPVQVDRQGKKLDVTTGVILAQVLHHGNVHREQVCTILTVLGVEPPDLSGWGYGGAHGHIVESPRPAPQIASCRPPPDTPWCASPPGSLSPRGRAQRTRMWITPAPTSEPIQPPKLSASAVRADST